MFNLTCISMQGTKQVKDVFKQETFFSIKSDDTGHF